MLLQLDFLLVFHSILQHNFFECIYIYWGYPNHFLLSIQAFVSLANALKIYIF